MFGNRKYTALLPGYGKSLSLPLNFLKQENYWHADDAPACRTGRDEDSTDSRRYICVIRIYLLVKISVFSVLFLIL